MDIETERFIKVEERCKSNTHRIDALEKLGDNIAEQNKNIAALVIELRHTNEHLTSQEQRIAEIEKQPVSRLDQIKAAIISALAGAAVGTIVTVLTSAIK